MKEKPKVFTTSMNRKVCWEDGFAQGGREMLREIIRDLELLLEELGK